MNIGDELARQLALYVVWNHGGQPCDRGDHPVCDFVHDVLSDDEIDAERAAVRERNIEEGCCKSNAR